MRGAWTFVRFPYSASEEFGVRGQVPVKGTINGVPYENALLPQGGGVHILVVKKEIRDLAGVTQGDVVEVVLERIEGESDSWMSQGNLPMPSSPIPRPGPSSTRSPTPTARPSVTMWPRPGRRRPGSAAPPSAWNSCWKRKPGALRPASDVPTVDWSGCRDPGVAGKRQACPRPSSDRSPTPWHPACPGCRPS